MAQKNLNIGYIYIKKNKGCKLLIKIGGYDMLEQSRFRVYYTPKDGVKTSGILKASSKTSARKEAKRILEKGSIIHKVVKAR